MKYRYKKVYRHPIMKDLKFVLVDLMENWAGGIIESETYYQRVSFSNGPLSFILIETNGLTEELGHCGHNEIGYTLALQAGKNIYHSNTKLGIQWALKKSIKENQVGVFDLLRSTYEKTYGECPYEYIGEAYDTKKPYQMDKLGDSANPDDWDKIKDDMDNEIDAEEDVELDEVVLVERPEQDSHGKMKPADELKQNGFKSIPGFGSLWSQSGKMPAEKKVVDGKIVDVTPEDNAKGKSGSKEPESDSKDAPDQQEPRTMKVVDKGSEEEKTAIAKRDGVKQKASTKTQSESSTSTDLNVPYSGDKEKEVDGKVAKGTGKSEGFTRDNALPDDKFSERNADNWLSDTHRLTLDHSAFDKTAVANTSLKVLERMINTNRGGKKAPTGDRAKASYYNGDEGGAGQAMSQAGELAMLTFMSVDNEEIDDFYETIENFIDENEDMSVLTKDWLIAARKNRDVTYKHLDAKYGEGNWEVHASGWDTKEEFESMYGSDYDDNKGYSTDAFFTIVSNGKAEMLEVSLKKDLGIFFLNSGPKYFMEVDPSLAGGDLDVNVHFQKEKERTKKAFSKAMASEADKLLKSKPSTKVSKELIETMKALKIKSVSELTLNFNDEKHRKLAYKAMGMLAEAGNEKAKKLIDETEQAYKDFSDNGIKEIQNNKKLNEGIMGRIREEFPLKSIAGSEEIMALGDQMIDRATMKEMFGTNDADLIMESLKVYKAKDGSAFLGYAAGQQGSPIPVAKIRLRGAGQGYTGRIKFDFEMHSEFKKVIQEANKKVYGGGDNEQS